MEATSLQIIKPSSNNAIELNEEALCNILLKDEIKDRYVSVISITGGFRQGKSFLLNFFLRYLRIKYVEKRDVTDWLQPEDGPLKGFKWSPGSKRHTAGIHMWPEIFLTKVPSGEKVAIILLDTQGSFDNQTTMGDCAKIFALSTLISSVQIYNVMRNIKQYDLTHLQCFGGYGSLLTNCGSAPFQNLCFLIRDWASPHEHPYGDAGGLAFLEEVLQTDNAEVRDQVENLRSLFKNMTCFLLPYPGRTVDISVSFNGDLNEIDELFKEHVQDFVTTLLSPENLVLKNVNGLKVTAEDLMCFIMEYSEAMKENSLPEIKTIFKATVEAHHKTASRQALKFYQRVMNDDVIFNPFNPIGLSENDLYHKHASNKVKAVDYFDKMKKFDDEEVYDKYLVDLKNKMDAEYKRYRIINEEKVKENEQRNERMQERMQLTTNRAGGSGLRTSQVKGALKIAAGVIGGAAVLAFGAVKLFSGLNGHGDGDGYGDGHGYGDGYGDSDSD